MSNQFMVRLFEFSRDHVQKAFDAVSQQVTLLIRRGEDDLWTPKMFGVQDKDKIGTPKVACIAYDRDSGKLVRFNGSSWVDLT